jgi:hypothetical protein
MTEYCSTLPNVKQSGTLFSTGDLVTSSTEAGKYERMDVKKKKKKKKRRRVKSTTATTTPSYFIL